MTRPGHTLLELIIALGIGSIVIGLGASIAFRHQRFHRDVVITVERTEQLEELVALLPISLRSIAPLEGDIPPGGARDTALEFRATIASAVVCDSGSATLMLAPANGQPLLTSMLARPEAGDTAWLLDASGAGERWTASAVTAVFDTAGTCRLGGNAPFGVGPRSSLALRLSVPLPAGTAVLRVTRPWRYSLYRASDGAWYLGAKEWNAASARFNTIQPVAGPLLSASAGGLRFRYLDSLGIALPTIPPEPRLIAAIEVALRVDSTVPGRYAHAASIRGGASTLIGLRNR